MKKFLLLSLLLLLSALTGCTHTRYIPMPEHHTRDSLHTRVNKYVDSIYIDRTHTRLLTHDTLLIRDSIYVEKWRVSAHTDTITVTRTDTVSIAVPCPSWMEKRPEWSFRRDWGADRRERGVIPRFYKICTLGFFLLLLALLTYTAIRFYLHR